MPNKYAGRDRRRGGWFQKVTPADWVKFVSILIGIGIAWGRLETHIAVLQQNVTAVVGTLRVQKQSEEQWRALILKLRDEDRQDVSVKLDELKKADDNLQGQIPKARRR